MGSFKGATVFVWIPVLFTEAAISRETDPTREVTGCYTPAPQLLIK